ncbi:MAG: glycosyltransferase [Clostridiales bacterium]|nr:glycosyltransferase [Clostridiales bacterium]
MPEVSIIVPIYNAEKYLKKCLVSILNQTFTDFELILVNDGSKDSSLSICQQYAATDNRIRVIDKENEGTVKTRARGLREALGNYVLFIDSDDWIAHNTIELLYNSAKTTDSDICVGKIVQVISSKGLWKRDMNANFDFHLGHSDLFLNDDVYFIIESFLSSGCFPCGLHAKLFKRSIFEGSYDYIGGIKFLGDDQYWNIGLFGNAKRVSLIDKPLYYYRSLFGGTSKYMPYFFNDVICGWENKIKAANDFCDDPKSYYGSIAQSQIDLLESCMANLFYSDMTDDAIKSKIEEYISNKTVKEILKWQIDGFSVEFTNALRNNDTDFIFEHAKNIANNQSYVHKILNRFIK